MSKNEYIHDKKYMLDYSKDYLVDEIHRLQRKCQRYEQRLEYIWNDDTILNLQNRIAKFERKELKAKLQIINKDSPIINLLRTNKQKGIPYTTVAKKLKITTSVLSRWVNGKEPIPAKRERQIYKLFRQS